MIIAFSLGSQECVMSVMSCLSSQVMLKMKVQIVAEGIERELKKTGKNRNLSFMKI